MTLKYRELKRRYDLDGAEQTVIAPFGSTPRGAFEARGF